MDRDLNRLTTSLYFFSARLNCRCLTRFLTSARSLLISPIISLVFSASKASCSFSFLAISFSCGVLTMPMLCSTVNSVLLTEIFFVCSTLAGGAFSFGF